MVKKVLANEMRWISIQLLMQMCFVILGIGCWLATFSPLFLQKVLEHLQVQGLIFPDCNDGGSKEIPQNHLFDLYFIKVCYE